MNISEQEIQKLKDAKSAAEWNAVCREIKSKRNGAYPPDWYEKVLGSGLMATVSDSWNK